MLGTGTTAFAAPLALGYAIHAVRRAPDRGWAAVALVLAALAALGVTALLGLWAASILQGP